MDDLLLKIICGICAGIFFTIISIVKSRKPLKSFTFLEKDNFTFTPNCVKCPLFKDAVRKVKNEQKNIEHAKYNPKK